MKVPKQLFIEDLSPEQIKVIEGRMRPSQYSHAGFLNQNLSLREVIEADAKVLEHHGITHKQVGDKLDSLMGQAFRQWDLASRAGEDYYGARAKGALVDDFLRVFAVCWMGSQQCPFFYETRPSEDGIGHYVYNCGSGSHDFTVKNERQGTEIRFPQLMAHLVRDHHFFEGDTSYRLNPEDAVKVLELKSGVDYTPKTETEILWRTGSSTSDPDGDFCGSQELLRSAERTVDVASGIKLYLDGDKGLIVAREHVDIKEPLKIDGAEVCYMVQFIVVKKELIELNTSM
ncbi:MAG: hypothetical protein KKB65_02190 [Nanoarchaeota archaeon]|nr:hypothetical protein [Nanoarchaeota archaeon]MBU1030020.1 hypothetical protein [Nanoarchaeota archaeon]